MTLANGGATDYMLLWLITVLVLLPTSVFIHSTLSFKAATSQTGKKKSPPTVPYLFPLLHHALPLGVRPCRFVSRTLAIYGWQRPLRIYVGWLPLTIISNPSHIQAVFRSSKHLSSNVSIVFALRRILNTPKDIVPFYLADDSGLAAKPKKGSVVKHEDRINFHQAHTARRFLSSQHLAFLNQRYVDTFDREINNLQIPSSGDWVRYPDLYSFFRVHVARASIETLMGSKILEINQSLIEDFWKFDSSVPQFTRCLPRWLIPSAYEARDRLLKGIKAWHTEAHTYSDCSQTGEDDPEWEPYFGSKLTRARQRYASNTNFMNADATASEDLGLLMASISNSVACIFWYAYEAVKDEDLRTRLLSEVALCTTNETGKLNALKLATQPLLQSAYAEVLRLRVATATTRTSEMDDFDVDGYQIPKGETMVIFSRGPSLNAEAWALAGRELAVARPLEDFWADRFLMPQNIHNEDDGMSSGAANIEPKFSLNGTAGCWLPYGGGERMCPGRKFAKSEIISTIASLLSQFDLELIGGGDTTKVEPDLNYVPTGGLPPTRAVPFRMRRRAT